STASPAPPRAGSGSRCGTAPARANGPTPSRTSRSTFERSARRSSAGRTSSMRAGRPTPWSTGPAPSRRPTRCSGRTTRPGARPGSERGAKPGRARPLLGRLAFRARLEGERRGVHAVAQARRAGPVVEDVAEMRPAVRACRLDPAHEQGVVFARCDAPLLDRVVEARPARAGLELRAGVEQRRVAHDAAVRALGVVVPIDAREGALGLALLGDGVLQ